MGLNYYASSAPTLVLSPNQQNLHFGGHYQDHQSNNSIMNAAAFADLPPSTTMIDLPTSSASSTTTTSTHAVCRKSVRPRFPRPPSINYLATSGPLSGRKRSIADVNDSEPHVEIDADGSYRSPTEQPPSPPKPRGEPIYGPGMTLIYPDDPAFSIAAESQTGTWAEEKNERTEAEIAQAVSRPPVMSRKSQRMIEPDSIAVENPIASINTVHTNGHSPSSSDPPVDHLSITLGIGWKRIPTSQAPAAKGWEKYILNHYDNILDPSILLHNEGLRVYLVRSLSAASDTQECWWVFQEDLSACRLIGFCEEDAIRNLQKNTTMGPTIPAQSESRRASLPGVEQMPMAAAVLATGSGDVEMEM